MVFQLGRVNKQSLTLDGWNSNGPGGPARRGHSRFGLADCVGNRFTPESPFFDAHSHEIDPNGETSIGEPLTIDDAPLSSQVSPKRTYN